MTVPTGPRPPLGARLQRLHLVAARPAGAAGRGTVTWPLRAASRVITSDSPVARAARVRPGRRILLHRPPADGVRARHARPGGALVGAGALILRELYSPPLGDAAGPGVARSDAVRGRSMKEDPPPRSDPGGAGHG